jgi:NAD(P)-dependent dehydrogenase (short-subunit alcohol dehydrogenase family)
VALVTAASRGIGRAVSERLAGEGMTVIAAARTGGAEERIGDGVVRPVAVDLGDFARTERLVADTVAAERRLDVLVLNTPGPPIRPALETSWEDWQQAHEQLLRPVVTLGTSGARQMKEQGSGAIVLLSSTWVRQPAHGGVLSSSYRSAAAAFVKTLAGELAPHGVRAVQVMPGATGTERMQGIIESKVRANGTSEEQERAAVVRDIPLGRWAEATEIADVVAFLASPRSAFVTGASLQVDGGAVRATY